MLNTSDISRRRGELMGFAIVLVVLFHISLPRQSAFYGWMRMGNIGVDIFLFLSGMGLWFSWSKSQVLRRFYERRLWRIYPAWLVVAALYYVPLFMKDGDGLRLAGQLLVNWGFWERCELTFWYVPATLALYLVAPFYMMLLRRDAAWRWLPVVAIVWCVAIQWVRPLHESLGYLEIFWSRIPIFLIGINMGQVIKEGRPIGNDGKWMSLLVFGATLALCVWLEQHLHGRFPLFIERMVYIPMTVSMLLILCWLFDYIPQKILQLLCFLGGISLEIYLLHVQFVLLYVQKQTTSYWLKFALVMLITVPLAWLLHWLTGQLAGWLQKK